MPKLGTRKLYYKQKHELSRIKVGRDKLFAILKANHLLIKPKKIYHITKDSHHRFRKHKNLIKLLGYDRPKQGRVSDINYIGNIKNPSYLALITDAYSKKIMCYDVSKSLEVSGNLRALDMVLKERIFKQEPFISFRQRLTILL